MTHSGPQRWEPITEPQDCDALRGELDRARAAGMKYPTASDAKAAGYFKVTPYVEGISAHWLNLKFVTRFNPDEPGMLLYDGNGEDAHLDGISYWVLTDTGGPPKEGFTGPNELYHRHDRLCFSTTEFIAIGDSQMSPEECARRGGITRDGPAWMLHAWVVPGCESPWGVFSAMNPVLDDQLNARSGTNSGGCQGSAVKHRYDLSPGQPG